MMILSQQDILVFLTHCQMVGIVALSLTPISTTEGMNAHAEYLAVEMVMLFCFLLFYTDSLWYYN